MPPPPPVAAGSLHRSWLLTLASCQWASKTTYFSCSVILAHLLVAHLPAVPARRAFSCDLDPATRRILLSQSRGVRRLASTHEDQTVVDSTSRQLLAKCHLFTTGLRRSGSHCRYVNDLHNHSKGPNKQCCSQIGEITSCSVHTASTMANCPVRSTFPNSPKPCP